MSLEVWTARISTKDPDRYNVARKGGDPVFAPSWQLLKTLLEIRRVRPETDEEWRDYAMAYLKEMGKSYALNKEAWKALLGRTRVVLTCYCPDPNRCHRRILGRILASLGADYKGELLGTGSRT